MSRYQNSDIEALKDDLVAAFAGITPGTGVNVIGVPMNSAYVNLTDDTYSLVAGFRFISIANIGETDGQIDGVVIPSGATVTFPAILNNTYGAKVLDATDTAFLIITVD